MSKKETRSKILEIMHLAMLCYEIDYYCFADYHGHVNQFHFRLKPEKKKWKGDSIEANFYINGDPSELEKCNNIIYQLQLLLKEGKIDYDKLYKEERIEFDYKF